MNLSSNTILITGGASGIGLALATRFIGAGSKVIICGRRPDKLKEAAQKYPELHTYVYDVSLEDDRAALYQQVTEEFPEINMLVNNAGIQRRMQLNTGADDWTAVHEEIEINLEAPIHLSMLFLPHLMNQQNPAIVNVSSGLAFVPPAFAPVYGATKAAIHSFTMSLRSQLSGTPVKVYEIIPPAVNTDLGGPGLHDNGVPLDEFADAMIKGLQEDAEEIGYGFSEKGRKASREELNEMYRRMNSH